MNETTAKPSGYYGLERADVVAKLPVPIGRVLDVGCGEGGVARSLRAAGATEVVGIEIVPAAAKVAEQSTDQVVCGSVEDALAGTEITGPFDTVCCYDVLEHLVDPPTVLKRLRELSTDSSHLHISIPNARHFSLVFDLVRHGTFGYTEHGHRDNTHLRWYTKRDLIEMVETCGWRILSVQPAIPGGKNKYVDAVTRKRAREFLAIQWHLLAIAA